MGAVIQMFPRAVKAKNMDPSTARSHARRRIVLAVCKNYGDDYPSDVVLETIKTTTEILERGGSLVDIEKAVEDSIAGKSMLPVHIRLGIVALDICRIVPESEYQDALDRAQRVLEGGGTVASAVYHAIKGNI